ncbi:hypothetical protein [Glycocaulis sp.]|uniref:hypothetical protein n=1 Tax=Glycocaulis sp. TaxID=1969725 RepID=UPI003F71CCC5
MSGLLEGLEAAVVSSIELPQDLRFDAQFFQKAYIAEDQALHRHQLKRVGKAAFVTDGPHGYHEVDEHAPTAMLTAKCAGSWFADRSPAETVADWVVEANKRSFLENDDLILSTRGTVGNCAIVTDEALPSIIDQDVARISLSEGSGLLPQFVLTYLNSKFGQDHIARHSSGMVQQGMSLAKVREIPIPILSDALQSRIKSTVKQALSQRRQARSNASEAEQSLLGFLGLANWTPPEPLAYTARASDVFASGRFDARFFAPRIQALLDLLAVDGRTIADVAAPRREKFRPDACAAFDYIEISDIDGAGAATSTRLTSEGAPSRATWHVRAGDIITSTVRPIRRLSAQITPEQDGYVCSSGFVVVTPRDIAPEVLLTYLRLPVICELLDLFASASMYPAITDADIFNLPLPHIPDAVADQVTQNVIAAKAAKARAASLLEAAKRAVEIAIEDGEPAAMAYLDQAEEAI